MNIHRMYWPVHVLGPGARLGIWTRGCARRCPLCMSEDLQSIDPAREIAVNEIIQSADMLFNKYNIGGVTISGGEPFLNPDEMYSLEMGLRSHTNDILVYTGYTEEEVAADPALAMAASAAGVVVYGPYVDNLNDGKALRGSSNQTVVFNDQALKEKYARVLNDERHIQIGESGSSIFLIGILG